MRLSPGHLACSDNLSDRNRQVCDIVELHCLLTEQRSQALGSLKKSGGLDGIVITGIHGDVNKRFFESVEPSASQRICCLCSHNCGRGSFFCFCKVQCDGGVSAILAIHSTLLIRRDGPSERQRGTLVSPLSNGYVIHRSGGPLTEELGFDVGRRAEA